MKKIFPLFLLCIASFYANSQTYKYYIIEGRPTGKFEIAVAPEKGIMYEPEVDSLLCIRNPESKKNPITEIKYDTISELFNALGKLGLQYVGLERINRAGGATGIAAGGIQVAYFIFKKEIKAE